MHLLIVSLHKLTMLYSKANLSSEWSQYLRKNFSQNYDTKLDTVHHSSRPLYHQNTANLQDQIIIRIMQLVFEAKPELSPPFSKAILSSEWSQSPWPNLNQNHATNLLGYTRLSPPFSKAILSSEWSQSPWPNLNQDHATNLLGHTSLSSPFSKATLSSEWSKSPGPNLNQNHATNLPGHTRLSPPFSKATLSSEWSKSPGPNLNPNHETSLLGQTRLSLPLSKATLSSALETIWFDTEASTHDSDNDLALEYGCIQMIKLPWILMS